MYDQQNIENTLVQRPKIPRSAFDREYQTEWLKEVHYLEDHGIHYNYVKHSGEYNIRQYKYTKTPELFAALQDFYTQQRLERQYRKFNEAVNRDGVDH